MHARLHNDESVGVIAVSTGTLPAAGHVQARLRKAHERYRSVEEGAIPDYIPALAQAPPELFGLCIVGTSGATFTAGD